MLAARLAAVGLAAHCLPALAAISPQLRAALQIRDQVPDAAGVALTFDDGPHPRGTPAVLELLRAADAPATFFLVGEQVRRTGSLAAEIVAAGHTVALHCDRHRNLLRIGPRELREDLARAIASIEAASGRTPTLYRPPYGIFSPAALALCRHRGWDPVLWMRWGRDWRARATPTSIATLATSGLVGGDIVLLHDADDYSAPGSWRRTVAALPQILDEIARRQLVPVLA